MQLFLEVLHLGDPGRSPDLDQEVLEGGLDLIRGLVRPGGDLNLDSILAIIFEDLILLMPTNLTLRMILMALTVPNLVPGLRD